MEQKQRLINSRGQTRLNRTDGMQKRLGAVRGTHAVCIREIPVAPQADEKKAMWYGRILEELGSQKRGEQG